MTRRLAQLLAGLLLYGISLAFVVRAGLGLAPWDVLHQGLTELTGASIGSMVIAASFVVLLLWIPAPAAAWLRDDRQRAPRRRLGRPDDADAR